MATSFNSLLSVLLILSFSASHAAAADTDPLQDFSVALPTSDGLLCKSPADADPSQHFCVALPASSDITINGLLSKPPAQIHPSDFTSVLLRTPNPISPDLGSALTLASALNFSALNTLGLSFARIDYAPQGLVPPHVHPRASEVLYVAQGTLQAGFVTSTPDNTLFQQNVSVGELFLFPRGVVHFQFNPDKKTPALAFSALSSDNPGTTTVAAAAFAAKGSLPEEILEKAFHINDKEVSTLTDSVAETVAA